MKIITSTVISTALLCALTFSQAAFAGSSIERETRSQKIEALQLIIRDGRIERSKRVQAKLDLARLQSEARKDRRNGGSSTASRQQRYH